MNYEQLDELCLGAELEVEVKINFNFILFRKLL